MNKLVRMHLPALGGGPQQVNADQVDRWVARGGTVLPDLTPDEIDAAKAADKDEADAHAVSVGAQNAADKLRLADEEAQLKAASAPHAVRPSKPIASTLVDTSK